MTGGNVAYLLLVIGSFLAFSQAMFYASREQGKVWEIGVVRDGVGR